MEGDVSLGSMERIMESETGPKKTIKWAVIIPIIALVVVVVAAVIIIIFATSGDKDNKDTCIIGEKEKCATCDGDKCGSCNYGYILVDGVCQDYFSFVSTYNVQNTEESI